MGRCLFMFPLMIVGTLAMPGFAQEPESAVGPVMKLFLSGRLPAERQPAVVEMICNRGNEHDLKVIFDRVVQPEGFPDDLRIKAMHWMGDAAVTRKVKPQGNLGEIEKLLTGDRATKSPATQQAAIKLASLWKDAAIVPALQKLVSDPATKPDMQRVAIEGLVAIGDPSSRQTLEKLTTSGNAMPTRMKAAAGLAGIHLPTAATAAAAILAEATPQADSDELINAFLDMKGGADQLAKSLEKQKLHADVAKRALRFMYSVGRSDAALSNLLSTAAGIATDKPLPTLEEVVKISADVVAKGDAVRGEVVFRRKDVNCMKCHSINRAGGQVGPDLSAVGGSSPVDYIVNSILNPNLAVKEQYVTRIFELKDGLVLTGVLIDRDDVRVNIRDAKGQKITIPVANIEDEAEGRSMMPEGLTKFLTYEELLDLAKYISELGKPGPFAVQNAKTLQRWRVMKNPPNELTTDVPHLEHLRQFVFESPDERWESAYGKVSGVLPLEELRPTGKPTVLILQGEVNVSEAGMVAVQIRSTEPLQSWLDTDFLDTAREFEKELAPGKHTLTLRVEVGDRAKPELRVEWRTPGNSLANFEMIGGQ